MSSQKSCRRFRNVARLQQPCLIVTDNRKGFNDPAVQEAVTKVAEALGDTGRILVRESGTEPVVRVMVEAPDHDTCQKYVSKVVDVIRDRGYSL